MSNLRIVKTTIFIVLLTCGIIANAEEKNTPKPKRILAAGLYEQAGNRFSFGHRELINWHLRSEEAMRGMNLSSTERISEVKRSGKCFETGECQKTITLNLPLEILDGYAEFLALTAQGEVHPVHVVKIETDALLLLSAQGKVDARSSGYGRLIAELKAKGSYAGGFVFALPNGSGKMHVENVSTKDQIRSNIGVSEKSLMIEGQEMPNRERINVENIKKLYKASFENSSDRYVAIYWTAGTPCQENFSLFHLDSINEEPVWLGWGCDL